MRRSTLTFIFVTFVAALFGLAGSSIAADAPTPLLQHGQPVDWWFVYKFNSASYPGCGGNEKGQCPFGGKSNGYKPTSFSQQFVSSSSGNGAFQKGSVCVGTTTSDPVGATFGEIYNGSYNFVIWNDQFYKDPTIAGCSGDGCTGSWGHSKGILAWNNDGEGLVMQVTTPSWPASGTSNHPRTTGNTLGCIARPNNLTNAQHFFALKLTKDDLVKVLTALQNSSIVTKQGDAKIVKNGGPADVQALVTGLGTKSSSVSHTKETLSSGVELISKPSGLHVPPWQMVSALLGGVSLRTGTWWASPKIYTTTKSKKIGCWDSSLGSPGRVEIATTGEWGGKEFGMIGGSNHGKIGVSISGSENYSIFGDLNQQGAISGTTKNCGRSQNGRGGMFFVLKDKKLFDDMTNLLDGDTAPTKAPTK